jgi:predicted permease
MLFVNVYNIESFDMIQWDVVVYTTAVLLLVFVLGMCTAVWVTDDRKRKGAILQSTFRSNNAIVGLSLASVLGGPEAVAVAAVVSAFSLPVMNILAVIALSLFVDDSGKISVKNILLDIVRNPLIQGVAMGMLFLALRWAQSAIWGEVVFSLSGHAKFLYTLLTWLKNVTTPLALLVLGGQFVFSAVKALKKEIIISTFCRLVLAPMIGIGGAYLVDRVGLVVCGPADYPALVALFASPVAVSSAIMATQMKNDEQLATQLVVWTTLFSSLTVFLTAYILMATGLIPA